MKLDDKTEAEFSKIFCDDHLRGQQDCKAGKPHVNGSEAYNDGYSTQYTREQIATDQERSCHQYGKH